MDKITGRQFVVRGSSAVLGAAVGAKHLSAAERKAEEKSQVVLVRSQDALDDERIHILNIGMRLKEEVDANIKILAGDGTCTLDDRALLAEFCAKAYDSDAIRKMRVD